MGLRAQWWSPKAVRFADAAWLYEILHPLWTQAYKYWKRRRVPSVSISKDNPNQISFASRQHTEHTIHTSPRSIELNSNVDTQVLTQESTVAFFPELSLGIAFTMISLAPMVPDWVSDNPEPRTKINVIAGLPVINADQSGDRDRIYKDLSFGGCPPTVSLFNANGDRVAYSRNDDCNNIIDQNVPQDIWVDYIEGGSTEKSEYITISASGTDAIYISAVVVTYPSSSNTYAFLPGEVAAVCGSHDPAKNYFWSESASTVQFKGKSGDTQQGRPKCLWIDKPDDDGMSATHFQGFQVHLPDFKLDNSTFKIWEDNHSQMCDSLSRFGAYDTLNEIMCPQTFTPAPKYGERLPLTEVPSGFPSSIPADDDILYPDFCYDSRLAYKDRLNIAMMYNVDCTEEWYLNGLQGDCEGPEGFERRDISMRNSIRSVDNRL